MWPGYKQTKFDSQIKKAHFCAKDCETVHISSAHEKNRALTILTIEIQDNYNYASNS